MIANVIILVVLLLLLIGILVWAFWPKTTGASLFDRTKYPCRPIAASTILSALQSRVSLSWSTIEDLIIQEMNSEISTLNGSDIKSIGTVVYCGADPYFSSASIPLTDREDNPQAYFYPNGCTVDASLFDQWPMVCAHQSVVSDCGVAPAGYSILAANVESAIFKVPCVEVKTSDGNYSIKCLQLQLTGQVFFAVDCNSVVGSNVKVIFIGFGTTQVEPVQCFSITDTCDWTSTDGTIDTNCQVVSNFLAEVAPDNALLTIYEEVVIKVSEALSGTSFTLPLASAVGSLCTVHESADDDDAVLGCMDPRASNYNSKANVYDGSCEYDDSNQVQMCVSDDKCSGNFPCSANNIFDLINANVDGGITGAIKSAMDVEICGENALFTDHIDLTSCNDDGTPWVTTDVFIPLYAISGLESAPCMEKAAADALVAYTEYETWYADEVAQCALDEASACTNCALSFDSTSKSCKRCGNPTKHISTCECSKANRADPCQQTSSCSTLAESACASSAWSNAEDCYNQDGCQINITSDYISGLDTLKVIGPPSFCYSCQSVDENGYPYIDFSIENFGFGSNTIKIGFDASMKCFGDNSSGPIVAEISDFQIILQSLVIRIRCTGDGETVHVSLSNAYDVKVYVYIGSIGFACDAGDFLCENMDYLTADLLNGIYGVAKGLQNYINAELQTKLSEKIRFDVRPPQGILGVVLSCENPDGFICGSDSVLEGCTDASAANYNPLANVTDDTQCIYYGCTDSAADNYSESAGADDGSCTYTSGCTDPAATNYVPSATEEDGSCSYDPGSSVLCGKTSQTINGTTYTGCSVFSEPSASISTACETLYNNMVNIQADADEDDDTTDTQALATQGKSIALSASSGNCNGYYTESKCFSMGSKFFDSQADFEAVFKPVDIDLFTV